MDRRAGRGSASLGRRLLLSAGLAVVGGVLAALTNVVKNPVAAMLIGSAAGLAGFVGSWLLSRAEDTVGGTAAGDSLDRLAVEVTRRWRDEAVRRGVLDPEPLRVRFELVGSLLDQRTLSRAISPRGYRNSARLNGEGSDIVDRFDAAPDRRMVILGEPGAGKTVLAMLLTLGLIERRRPDEPVPVIFSLAGWRPDARGEGLDRWLARRLAEDYGLGTVMAERFVARGEVLPVLDGLDEMPGELRAAAVRGINAAVAGATAGAGRSFVVTCRSAEYREAGYQLLGAVAVELQPVSSDAVAEYLTGDPWRPVLDELTERPDGPLAAAFVTPLMVWLARGLQQPGELLGAASPDDVRRHLLDAFVDAAYADDLPRMSTSSRWDPRARRRWLAFLAGHVPHGEFSWWNLRAAVPAGIRAGLFAAVTTLIALCIVAPPVAIAFGLSFGVAVGWPGSAPPPRRIGFTLSVRASVEYALFGGGFGLVVGLAAGSVTWMVGAALAGAVIGLVAGASRAMAADEDLTRATGAVHTLRNDRRATLGLGLAAGVVTGAVAGGLLGSRLGPWAGVTAGVAVCVVVVIGLGATFAAAFGLAVGFIVASSVRVEIGEAKATVVALVVGTACGAALGLAASASTAFGASAWTQWLVISRLWLPLTGRLPWSITAFLTDAHERGLLRQAGPRYEFRHALLQDHLAAPTNGEP